MLVKKSVFIVLSFLVIGILLFVLEHLEPPANTFLWRELFNTGHTPLFGVLSLLFLTLSVNILGQRLHPYYRHYAVALAIAVITGVASEFIQIFGSRDADIWDFNRDIAGAVVFLGLYATFDRRITGSLTKSVKRFFPVLRTILVIFFVLTFIPIFIWFGAYNHRNNIFPVLLTFDSKWENKFLQTHHARLEIVPPPLEWPDKASGKMVRINYLPATWPDFEINEPHPDWTGYDSLSFSVFSTVDTTVKLSIRIEDSHHNHQYHDRFTLPFFINNGLNRISIPLDEVARAPETRPMDMTAIYAIHLYAYKLTDSLVIYYDNFRLK